MSDMFQKAPAGTKKNFTRFPLNMGDSIVLMQGYLHESNTAVLFCSPDPLWSTEYLINKSTQPTSFTSNQPSSTNRVTSYLMKILDKANIQNFGFEFTKYNTSNNNYNKFITQTSLFLETFLAMREYKKLIIVGYSLGALVAMNLVLRRQEIDEFIMIAPPLLYYDFVSWVSSYKTKGLLVYGGKDSSIPQDVVSAYLHFLERKKIQVSPNCIPEASHTFANCLPELGRVVLNYITNQQ